MSEERMQELLEKTEEANRLSKKHILTLRICIAVMLVLTVVLGLLLYEMKGMSKGIQQLGEAAAQLDMETLENSLRSVDEQLSRLDVDKLNETLTHAAEAANHMEKAAQGFEQFGQGMGNLFRP